MRIFFYSSEYFSDVNKISEGIGEKPALFIQWTSAFVAGFIIGFIYGWKLTLVLSAVSPILVICIGIFEKVRRSLWQAFNANNHYFLISEIHLRISEIY